MKKSNQEKRYNVFDKSEILYFANSNAYVETIYNNSNQPVKIDFFQYDENLIQSYCFENGATGLYRDIGNDKFELLYEKDLDVNGNEIISIFPSNTSYYALKEDNKFKRIILADQKTFNTFTKMSGLLSSGLPLISRFSTYISDQYAQRHFNPIVDECTLIDTPQNRKLYEDFKSRYMRYERATNYIPACGIINELIQMIHHYIATRELDKEELLTKYIKLMNFQQMCPKTLQALGLFFNDLNGTDLRNLCDQLQNSAHNIESFIDLNLKDELKDKGENYVS